MNRENSRIKSRKIYTFQKKDDCIDRITILISVIALLFSIATYVLYKKEIDIYSKEIANLLRKAEVNLEWTGNAQTDTSRHFNEEGVNSVGCEYNTVIKFYGEIFKDAQGGIEDPVASMTIRKPGPEEPIELSRAPKVFYSDEPPNSIHFNIHNKGDLEAINPFIEIGFNNLLVSNKLTKSIEKSLITKPLDTVRLVKGIPIYYRVDLAEYKLHSNTEVQLSYWDFTDCEIINRMRKDGMKQPEAIAEMIIVVGADNAPTKFYKFEIRLLESESD